MTNVTVNKQQWDSLDESERQKITKGLRESGAILESDSIIGSDAIAPFDAQTQLEPMWNPLQDLCKAACDVAAGTALAWCTANTAGVGLAVCAAAAEAARQECKNRC